MKIDILTLFPEMFQGPFSESILKKATEKELLEINIHNLRNWATDKHKKVDDRPFGGGTGMILMIAPIDKALKDLRTKDSTVVLTSPKGQLFGQSTAQELSTKKHIIIIAGHYEGFDERIAKHLADKELSIGNYILTGGELPAMVIADAVARLIPGVLSAEATQNESFTPSESYVEHPQYTRPAEYNGWKVPSVLLSGDHKAVADWKQKNSKS